MSRIDGQLLPDTRLRLTGVAAAAPLPRTQPVVRFEQAAAPGNPRAHSGGAGWDRWAQACERPGGQGGGRARVDVCRRPAGARGRLRVGVCVWDGPGESDSDDPDREVVRVVRVVRLGGRTARRLDCERVGLGAPVERKARARRPAA